MYSHLVGGEGVAPPPLGSSLINQPPQTHSNHLTHQPHQNSHLSHPAHLHTSNVYYGPTHDIYGTPYQVDEGNDYRGADPRGGGGVGWAGAGNAANQDWHHQAIINHRHQAQLGVNGWDYDQRQSPEYQRARPGWRVRLTCEVIHARACG